MTKGRSIPAFERVYINGYDLSGYTNDAGEQGVEHSEADFAAFSDAITGTVAGKPKISFGPLNGVFDNTASVGIHAIADAAKGTVCNILHARGVIAAPAIGDDVFCGPFYLAKHATTGANIVTASLAFSQADVVAAMAYDEFFGQLVHAWANETGANAANSTACDGLAQTTAGGWLMYQIYSISGGAGTATVSIDDSATGAGGSWAALAGATSGAIAFGSAPTAGIVQLATNATVRRYIRWQLALAGGATGCTFALAFMRGR